MSAPDLIAGDLSLEAMLQQSPYAAYAYSYPHKTAYRPLDPPIALRQAWADERRDALFLYLHLPFCEMRCGFCSLFTTTNRTSIDIAIMISNIRQRVGVAACANRPFCSNAQTSS